MQGCAVAYACEKGSGWCWVHGGWAGEDSGGLWAGEREWDG